MICAKFNKFHYIYKQKGETDHKLNNRPIRCQYFKHIMHANDQKSEGHQQKLDPHKTII